MVAFVRTAQPTRPANAAVAPMAVLGSRIVETLATRNMIIHGLRVLRLAKELQHLSRGTRR